MLPKSINTEAPAREAREEFWSRNQPGFRFSSAPPGTPEFFDEVERHRYAAEPHIPEVVGFELWRDCDVLDAGCGIATDGVRFARAGARYTGVDQSAYALDLSRRRFEAAGLNGEFIQASVTDLPFPDSTFDLVYSHGVVHHVPDPRRAIDEFHRVLRPAGTALVMLYHRHSFNYGFTIMVVRRALAGVLAVPRAAPLLARLTGETEVLDGHRALLQKYGLRYVIDPELFLSNNTDGPGNPLSRAFSRREALELFSAFEEVRLEVRFLNLRLYPGGQRFSRTRVARALGTRLGWHLYVFATKEAA